MTSLKQYHVPIPREIEDDPQAVEQLMDSRLAFNGLVRCGEVVIAKQGFSKLASNSNPFASCLANRDGVNDRQWNENVEVGVLYEAADSSDPGAVELRPVLI